jgi:hypothetical protein
LKHLFKTNNPYKWIFSLSNMGQNEHSGKVIDSSTKLMRIDTKNSWSGVGSSRWGFHEGTIRSRIAEIFETGQLFTLFRTYANSKLIEAFDKYVAVRKDSNTPYQVREKRDDDRVDEYPCTPNTCIPLHFDMSLLSRAHSTIEKLAKQQGVKIFVNFPLVQAETNAHCGNQDESSVYWPVIYVVRGEDSAEIFRDFLLNYSTKEFYDLMMKGEDPNRHHGLEINLLRQLTLKPVIVDSKEWQVDSKNLKKAVDFLVPFTLSYDSNEHSVLDD